jgi:hypothetical protein
VKKLLGVFACISLLSLNLSHRPSSDLPYLLGKSPTILGTTGNDVNQWHPRA